MQMPTMVCLTAVAMLMVVGRVEAGKLGKAEPGETGNQFIKHKSPKVSKDYYVVRQGQTDQCSIVTGNFENKPEGMIGGAPYATAKYAKAALKTFPECKGGEADEDEAANKHPKKK